MPLFTHGLSHKTAPLEVRERLVFDEDRARDALGDLVARPGVREAALISTCNRTEVYTVLEPGAPPQTVLRWLAAEQAVDPGWLADYLYVHHDGEMVRHLLRVAPGLDSLVLGEPQISGQIKLAYNQALAAGTLGRVLDRLFQHAFSVSKQVRTETGIGSHPVSVAFAAVTLARQIFGDLNGYTGLLIGAGETIELTARHFHEQGMRRFIVANRSAARAEELAGQYNGEAIDLGSLPGRIEEADVVVASTGSQLPILGKGVIERAVRRRKHRPMFMVDIAVPRDIEPEAGDLDDVYLYTVDDLQEVIDDNLRSRQDAATQAEEIIDVQVERFEAWLRGLDAVPLVRAFRERSASQRDAVLARARRRLARGDDPEAVLEYLAHTLTNRLIHTPTRALRDAGSAGNGELLAAARRLLDVDPDEG